MFSENIHVKPGQLIVINSTGTHVVYENENYWLVNGQNIAAVLED